MLHVQTLVMFDECTLIPFTPPHSSNEIENAIMQPANIRWLKYSWLQYFRMHLSSGLPGSDRKRVLGAASCASYSSDMTG